MKKFLVLALFAVFAIPVFFAAIAISYASDMLD